MKLIKGDEVKIVKGKDKGKKGKIEKVFAKKDLVLIPGMNQYKRHIKARTQNEQSQIVTLTKPVRSENVALICPKCKKQTRIGYKVDAKSSKKVRVCRKCGKEI